MTDPTSTRRFRPTPAWLVLALLVVEGLLWLSERYEWFSFNEKKGWTVLICVAVVGVALLVMLLWFIASLVFRWRFQFSISSLLVLTVAVAVPSSWLAVEMKAARKQNEVVVGIEKLGGHVVWSDPQGPASVRSLLGHDFLRSVISVTFYNTHVKDDDLQCLQRLAQLQDLSLIGTEVTDAGLENLRGLNQLQGLWLKGPQFTDAGLQHVARLEQLRSLTLDKTQVTDVGLENLNGRSQLRYLHLIDAKVTDAGVKKLQQALPNCQIYR